MATTRALEDAEIFAMFENIRGKYAVRNRTMLTLGIHMALRATELCSLTVSDVYDGVGVRTYILIRGETAKFKKARKVRISLAIRSALRDFIAWKGENGEPLELESPLFISERGDHLSRKMLFVIVKLVLKNASINESPHCLRKTGATIYYIESDCDLIATQQFLGHEDPSTTRDYIGLTSQQMAEYCERSGNRLIKAMREGGMVRLDTLLGKCLIVPLTTSKNCENKSNKKTKSSTASPVCLLTKLIPRPSNRQSMMIRSSQSTPSDAFMR